MFQCRAHLKVWCCGGNSNVAKLVVSSLLKYIQPHSPLKPRKRVLRRPNLFLMLAMGADDVKYLPAFLTPQVDHRVSIAERAVEHLRHRVEELAEEVSSLGEVSRKCSASTKSHTGTLEQILAGEERSRCDTPATSRKTLTRSDVLAIADDLWHRTGSVFTTDRAEEP